MSMDILEALNDANPERGAKRCKLARTLDDIDDDTAGKDALVAAVASTEGWPAQRLAMTFAKLGLSVGPDVIRDHRASRCVCYR